MRLTLKWRIFIFYILCGLLPLIILAYYSLNVYTDSIAETSQKQMDILVENIAKQIQKQNSDNLHDLDMFAGTPEIRLVFVQFLTDAKKKVIIDRLDNFRHRSPAFMNVSIYSSSNTLIVSSPADFKAEEKIPNNIFDKKNVGLFKVKTVDSDKIDSVRIYRKVSDFQHPEKIVGTIVADVNIELYTSYLKNLDMGFRTLKELVTSDGNQLFKDSGITVNNKRDIQLFSKDIPELSWTINVGVLKEDLYIFVNNLRNIYLLFSIAAVFLAVLAALSFSKRLTEPINKIIEGTKKLASGNLNHRISLTGGSEISKISEAIDNMAGQLKSRQEELERTNKFADLGILSAGIAHEIKNPMAGIKTSAQTIRQICNSNEICLLAEGIEEETERLTSLLATLLDFSRPKVPNKSLCSLKTILDKAVTLASPNISKKNIKLSITGNNQQVYADQDQILQVVLNILLNAVDAVDDTDGIIKLEIHKLSDGNVLLHVKDNGKGIAKSDLDKIFDPFYTRSSTGSGLGLSIAYDLLRRNDADIVIDSEVNKKTIITIIFKGDDSGEKL